MVLSQLLKNIKPTQVVGSTDVDITGVNIDSRRIKPGHLFVAMKGTQVDGHKFIDKAIELGAKAVLCEDMPATLADGVTYVQVTSTEDAVGKVATMFYGDPSTKLKLVGVTGTNGKTTSSRMIEQAFLEQGKSYFANRSGANLISGITTEFVINSSLSGKCRKEYAVIECDEAAARRVFSQLRPQVIVVTNLFRDQLDRYGEVTHTLENIREGIKGAPEAVLCLNADCSLTVSLANDLPNRAVFFGIDKGAAPSRPKTELSDASHCIYCKSEYEYDFISYGHLGNFRCTHCGYHRPKAEYAVTNVVEQRVNGSSVVLMVNGSQYLAEVNLPAMYNIYNAIGASTASIPARRRLSAIISRILASSSTTSTRTMVFPPFSIQQIQRV